MKRSEVLLGSLWLLLAPLACAEGEAIVEVGGEADTLRIAVVSQNSVTVEQLEMVVGDTARLSAAAFNAIGQFLGGITPEWYSTNSSVATVSQGGVVVAESEGAANIIATHEETFALIPAAVSAPASGPPPPDTTTPPPPDTTTPPPPPPPPGGGDGPIFFASDWSTTTGTSSSAILDGGQWSGGEGNWQNSFSVEPKESFPFPTANVLVQRGLAESGSWGQLNLRCCTVPRLEVGDSLGMRVYWQSPNPYGNVDNLLHGFEVYDPGNDPIGINSRYSGDRWQIEIDVPGGVVYADRGSDGFGAFALTRTGVYILEVLVVRVSSDQKHVQARLTDAGTGTVLYDTDEWPSYYDPNAAPMHEATPFPASSTGWDNLREWRIGINGIGNVDGQVVHRWGGFALCSGWCPAYTPGEGS